MVKYLLFVVLALVCLTFTGCSQDEAVAKFIGDLDTATKEIVKPVDDSPTVAGVDTARGVFNAKKDGLKEQLAKIRTGNASQEMATKLTESIKGNVAAVIGLQTKHRVDALNDEAFRTKLEALGNDYVDLFKAQ
jgi:hypothetical protein